MRKLLFVMNLLSLFLLTGCWDKNEIEAQAYVMVVGIDKAQENSIEITYQIGNPQVGSSQRGQSQTEPAYENMTFTAPDINSATDIANSFLARKITYDHLTTIIVSEELARTDQLMEILVSAMRERHVRRETKLIVSREKASEFIHNNKPKMETRPHKYYQFMFNETIDTGMIPKSDIHGFFQCTEGDADLYPVIYATTKKFDPKKHGQEDSYLPGQIDIKADNKNIVQMIGAAVFREGTMVGSLTGEELRVSLELDPTKPVKDMMVTYPDPLAPEYRITAIRTPRKDLDIKMDLHANRPKVDVTVHIDLEAVAVPSNINYMTDSKKQQLLKTAIELDIESKIYRLIEKTQTELKGDTFCWSILARNQFLTLEQYTNYDWMKSYCELDINVKVEVDIKGFGKVLRTTDIRRLKD